VKHLWAFEYWEELIWFAGLIIVAILSLYLVNFVIWLLAPFILAWLLTIVLRPFVRFFDRHLNLGRSINVAAVMLLVLGLGSVILFFLLSRVFFELKRIGYLLPVYFDQIQFQIDRILSAVRDVSIGFSPEFAMTVERGLIGLTVRLEEAIGAMTQYIFQLSFGVPELLIIVIIALVGTYFLSVEYERLKLGFRRLIPLPWRESLGQALASSGSALVGILRAQMILFGIAFIQLLIGFWLLHIEHWFTIAFFVFIMDILPIVGAGIVLIPWIMWSLLLKNTLFAFLLLILYLIVLITRNLLTPKLYAESFGLDPLSTLAAMYIGLKLIGVWGVFLAPFVLMVVMVFWKRFKEVVQHHRKQELSQ